MRIRAISAKGLLSFDDFTIPVHPKMTVIVGPNGAGKSNILQLVDIMLQGLELVGERSNEAQAAMDTTLEARYCGRADESVEVALAVEFTETREHELLTDFMQSAVFSALVGQSGGPETDEIAEWVHTDVTPDRLDSLWRGSLLLTHPGYPDTQWQVIYEIEMAGQQYRWYLGWGSVSGLTRAGTAPTTALTGCGSSVSGGANWRAGGPRWVAVWR